MISSKLNHKLLFFWLGSIILSLLILGSVFLFLNNELNQNAVRQQISDAFDDLSDHIGGLEKLRASIQLFTMRDDVVASLSMIHNYQNPKDYQSILFDVEKKALGDKLVEQLKGENVNIIAAYDGHMRLLSFAFYDDQNKSHIGYISYDNGKPRYFISDVALKNYHEVEKLPFWLEPVRDAAVELDVYAMKQGNMYVHSHGEIISIGSHIPVIRRLHNKSEEMIGLITVGELGRSFVEGVSKNAGLDLVFSVDGNGWVSTGDEIQVGKRIDVLPDEDLAAGNLQNWHWTNQPNYIYGIANYPLDNGGNLKFIFEATKLRLEFTILQQAIIAALLVNIFVLFPLGIYFLKRTVLRPVANLVTGIESLSKGSYKQLPVSPSNDELAFLTNAFNSMARSIQLRETELQKLSLAVEQSPISMIITNLKGDIEYVNPAFTTVTGYTSSEVIGENTRILRGDETSDEAYQQLWDAISSGQQWQGTFHNRKKNGDFIWVSSKIIPIKTPDGKTINYLALNENITQRRQTEERLYLQSEALQAAADGIVITDKNGIIEWVNPAYEEITGYAFEEAIGKNPKILKSGRQDRSFYEQLWQCILSGETWYGELYNKRKDGVIYLEEESITPVKDVSGEITHFVAVKRDITEHRQHEEIVRQSRKLEAIGEMAGGIAHDFNNLLGIMSGNLEILKRFSGDNADMNKWIDSGLKTAKRGAALTKRLLGFSKVHAAAIQAVSVSDMLEDMRSMIDKTAGLRVNVNYGLADELWLADIDAGDFEDAVINLVINAKDAMQEEGRLDISVYNEIINEDKASAMPGCTAGDYVVLCISDSGSGISKEVKQRMFDPFYSTKEQGKGTGLGLSLVHGFVRRSHGYLEVVSEPGMGAAFYIYLPRSTKDKSNGQDRGVKDELPTGTETILVVDDEAQLVEVAAIYLGDLGYQILQATGTKQAMAFLQGNEKIDLLFSDIIMPGGMDGYDLSEAAMRLHPGIKVLLVSGYVPEDSDLSNDARRLADQRLTKPYTKIELAQRVRLVLDGEQKND
ncbi:MAG: PAS domain S-box protein [Gammaproteobacteria bacterium]|nr:PAS domain S-box protein [Gammaproteobacteria bacterium]